MVRTRHLIILTAFMAMIAIPIFWAQTTPGDTQSQPSNPVVEQPEGSTQQPAQNSQAAPSQTPPQPSNPVAEQPEESAPEPVQQPAQNSQAAPSQTPPQPSSPVAEQPEESAPEPVQQPAQNSQAAPSQTPPQPSNPVAEQPEESAPAPVQQPAQNSQAVPSQTPPQPSNPVAEQPEESAPEPVQQPAQNSQAAPSQTPPQPSSPVAEQPEESAPEPVQQPAQNSQAAPSQTPPQPSSPVAEQPEESAPEPVQQPAQNSQAAPSQTPPQPSNPVVQQPEESAQKSGKHETEAEKRDKRKPLSPSATANPVLWKMPDDIAAKNLYWGQAGEQRQPKPPFVFLSEDRKGTSPKCNVRDASGRKWRVKWGAESRPEVVASRLLWAVGYFANDDYVLPEAHISGLKMKRKSDKMHGTQVIDARFARKPGGEQKIGIWKWNDNPFFGSREFNGLRVMMAVMNNWDLKDSNNAVYADRKNGTQIFLASDIGATFGANRYGFSENHAKGNLDSYEGSKFITHVSATEVDFGTPSPPLNPLAMAAGFGEIMYAAGMPLGWIGKHIPVEDARWIGTMLGQLSHQQLLDAFRAGNFPAGEAKAYVQVLEDRIAELKGL